MIGINFDKATAEHFVSCLADGGPIAHSGPWTADDMLTLAGACFFGVMSQGPFLQKVAQMMGKEVPEQHPEHAEASEEQFLADIHGAVEFLAELTMRVRDGEFDERYTSPVRALLDGASHSIQPIEGFRQQG